MKWSHCFLVCVFYCQRPVPKPLLFMKFDHFTFPLKSVRRKVSPMRPTLTKCCQHVSKCCRSVVETTLKTHLFNETIHMLLTLAELRPVPTWSYAEHHQLNKASTNRLLKTSFFEVTSFHEFPHRVCLSHLGHAHTQTSKRSDAQNLARHLPRNVIKLFAACAYVKTFWADAHNDHG